MSSPQQKNSAKLIGQNFENYSSSTNQISLDGGAHDTAAAALLWTQNMATVLTLYSNVNTDGPMNISSVIAEFFSRDSDLTTSVVRPLVSQSVSQSVCDQNLKTSLNHSL